MAHFAKICYTILLRLKLKRFKNAKNIAQQIGLQLKPRMGIVDRLWYWNAKYLHCGCIKTYFRINQHKKVMLTLFEMYLYITTVGTFPNYIATAIFGFLGGVIISYVYFTLCAIILDLSTASAFYISVFLCIFLTIGMAFFETVRCVVFSILPEMCTSRARAMLVSFALLLLITGPGSSILFNCGQLMDTVACTHEQVSNMNHNLTQIIVKPLRALKAGIVHLINHIKPYVTKLKNGIVYVKNMVATIGNFIKNAFSWLKVTVLVCDTKVGTPYDLCKKMMNNMSKNCRVRGFFFILNLFICNPFHIFNIVCAPLKLLQILCLFKTFIKDTVFQFLRLKIKQIANFIKTIFYVSISFQHSYDFETNQTKTLKDVIKAVYHAQQDRMSYIFGIFHIMKLMIGAYITYVLLCAFIYRYRFMYQTRFDNRHINKYLIELDTRRAGVNRQTLFPLTRGEKAYFVSMTALRLTMYEKKKFLQGSSLLFYSCLKIMSTLALDLLVSWILTILHEYGRIAFYFGKDQSIIGEGSGFFHNIYVFINRLIEPFDIEVRFDTNPCLPVPLPIDWLIYERIAITMGFAWFLAFFQPIGLRFRNHVMSYYYPEAARRRAVWLYNHILQTRGTFSNYIRRNILTRNAIGLRTERPDLYKWIIARFPRMYFILPYRNLYKECMVCGYINPKVRCATPDCPGMYCKDCFASINYICVICNMPQNFKGMDISEEEDSDGDDSQLSLQEDPKPWWKFWIQVSRTDDISLRALEEAITTTNQLSPKVQDEIQTTEPVKKVITTTNQPSPKPRNKTQTPEPVKKVITTEQLSPKPRDKTHILEPIKKAINTTNQPPPKPQDKTQTPESVKDYFNEKWRRDDWASLDDFQLPMPDLSTWTRPQYQIKNAINKNIE